MATRILFLLEDRTPGLITDGDNGHCRASNGASSVIVDADGSIVDLNSSNPESVLVDIDLIGVCRRLPSLLLIGPDLVDVEVFLGLDVTRSSGVTGPTNPDSLEVDVTV